MSAVMAMQAPRKTHLEGRTAAVDAALEAWARWARSGLSGLGWPPSTLLARIIEGGVTAAAQKGGVAIERDELCETIERAILRLHERERRVLVRWYMHWEPLQVSADSMSMSASLFRLVLHRARQRVADYLEGAQRLR
jgi:DNA-directed RNA polymerase specialized sigma24 family protein